MSFQFLTLPSSLTVTFGQDVNTVTRDDLQMDMLGSAATYIGAQRVP